MMEKIKLQFQATISRIVSVEILFDEILKVRTTKQV